MTLLDTMIVIVVVLTGLLLWKRRLPTQRLALWSVPLAGLCALGMIELGWMITEIGRQPWAVRGYVTTEQAITTSHTVSILAYAFPLGFILLFGITAIALLKIIRHEQQLKGGAL